MNIWPYITIILVCIQTLMDHFNHRVPSDVSMWCSFIIIGLTLINVTLEYAASKMR